VPLKLVLIALSLLILPLLLQYYMYYLHLLAFLLLITHYPTFDPVRIGRVKQVDVIPGILAYSMRNNEIDCVHPWSNPTASNPSLSLSIVLNLQAPLSQLG
jgi:hypothetical protein